MMITLNTLKQKCSFSVYTFMTFTWSLMVLYYLTIYLFPMMAVDGGFILISHQERERKNRRFCDVTLMGQFNFISGNISRWTHDWSDYFNDIVIATPDGTNIEDSTIGRPIFYKKDNGIVSPYSNILRLLKERKSIKCLLYVHDDLLITGSTLNRLGRSEWVSTVYQTDESDQLITLYRNGTSLIKNKNNKNLDNWSWWPGCRKAFLEMFDETVVKPYVQKSETGQDFINVRNGQADMLYLSILSSEQRMWLIDILELFTKHSMFLECAIPTAVFWMKTRFEIEVYNAKLCTDWGGLRGAPGHLIEKCKNEGTYNVFHPIKIGEVGNWSDYFNAIINL